MRQPVLRTGFGRLFRPQDPEALAAAAAHVLLYGPPRRPRAAELTLAFSNEEILERYTGTPAEFAT